MNSSRIDRIVAGIDIHLARNAIVSGVLALAVTAFEAPMEMTYFLTVP